MERRAARRDALTAHHARLRNTLEPLHDPSRFCIATPRCSTHIGIVSFSTAPLSSNAAAIRPQRQVVN